ncbi:amidohydrolase [Sporomusa acidovorans]|uniref:p-aminobenzoyl-glutamate hydrolase subunit A n=1 Tax=Sporomusa acidovorans (strain ATCC 49682 / DSM 3132 / Mol) TaxID=1123286 RepID=A0ABZ3J0Z6_SPOA4|nr:amidohydrolase [Sporomusa acidovorans]OZC22761.1 p-aminobenzoyl-glutamate hydrolase subunit A [Sporomusa acidovorans DSM 3132]SDE50193.1 aminobenzoyl-glutamate utilization protein A [Sporomusa acidovorans]
MNIKISDMAKALQAKTVARRRDFHKHPEAGWTEFRTAAVVADALTQLGYDVFVGDDVINTQAMMGVPTQAELERQAKRALEQGANPEWVAKMSDGKTGVVGVMGFSRPGPTVALRFDMDANDLMEAEDDKHRPYREKFASLNEGVMHACGHDGHTAAGLAVAEIISMMSAELQGTVKLIFQPAEEGVRGAKSMVEKGMVDDVDFMIGMHLVGAPFGIGQVGYPSGFMATTKVDADFTGVPAHAGANPEAGRNALLAAANALIHLHAISRHSGGDSRVNVGVLQGGSGRNVIPANASIKMEIRGSSSEVNDYMYHESIRIIEAAAAMQGVAVTTKLMGSAAGGSNSKQLETRITDIAKRLGIFKEITTQSPAGACDDYSYFMERVQQKSGQAVYTVVGAETAAVHHNSYFDFNEDALQMAVVFLVNATVELLKSEK